MIIVEGPDGAGKTTLIRQIQQRFGLPLHPKFAEPSGPPKDLYAKVFDDTIHFNEQPLQVYDRHSFWSEYIYSSVVRAHKLPHGFIGRTAPSLIQQVASASLVILVLPPLHLVIEGVSVEDQMGGVTENIEELYRAYEAHAVWWPNQNKIIRYDRTSPNGLEMVMAFISLHITEWNRDHGAMDPLP